MRSSHSLDRLEMAFDDQHLVSDAGLLLPATLADVRTGLGKRQGYAWPGPARTTSERPPGEPVHFL